MKLLMIILLQYNLFLNLFLFQKLRHEAVDDCPAALKFIPDWFVKSKMLEQLHDSLLANDDIFFFDEDLS